MFVIQWVNDFTASIASAHSIPGIIVQKHHQFYYGMDMALFLLPSPF
jgi:hypothetical protein